MIKILKICFKRNTILIKFWKSRKFFHKILKHFFCFVIQCLERENVHNWHRRWPQSALKAWVTRKELITRLKLIFQVSFQTKCANLEWIFQTLAFYSCRIHGFNLYIWFACLGVCLSACPFVSNKNKTSWTNRARIFCGKMDDRIFKNLPLTKLYFRKYWKSTNSFFL